MTHPEEDEREKKSFKTVARRGCSRNPRDIDLAFDMVGQR